MHDVAATSKTIASARRPDIFIASPRSRSDGQAPAFSGHIGSSGLCCSAFSLLTRLQVCDPTLSDPVEVRRVLGTGRRHDSSRTPRVAGLTYNFPAVASASGAFPALESARITH